MVLLTVLYDQDRNERDIPNNISRPFIFIPITKTSEIVLTDTNNTVCISSKKNMFRFNEKELRIDTKNMIQVTPLLPEELKLEDMFAPDR